MIREANPLARAALDPDRSPLRRMSIVSVQNDYLECHPFDPNGSANTSRTKYVMKPWTLRRVPFDGKTDAAGVSYTYSSTTERIATRSSTTEDQFITPNYNVGDEFYAILTAERHTLSGGPGDKKVTRLVDANLDGRAWATLPGS